MELYHKKQFPKIDTQIREIAEPDKVCQLIQTDFKSLKVF